MKVAVVVLNWNGQELLEKFLPSLLLHSQDEAIIYVADNNSSDHSVAYIQEQFPQINIIQNTSNGGYAKGYNDALKQVNEELLVLINSDVEVSPNWLTPIIKEFNNDDSLVAAQPKILAYNQKDSFEYAGAAGGFLDAYGYPYCRGRIFSTLEKDKGQYNDTIPIFWATGACLFVKNEAIKAVNGFDEDFFAHQEEIDLCWRLQANGGTIKYISTSTVYHVGGATLDKANSQKTFYNFRNSLLVLLKNVQGFKVVGIIFTRLLLDGVAGLQLLIQGKPKHAVAIIKAHFSFYSLIFKFLKKRKKTSSSLQYYHTKSIVWSYFIRKKRTFKQLN